MTQVSNPSLSQDDLAWVTSAFTKFAAALAACNQGKVLVAQKQQEIMADQAELVQLVTEAGALAAAAAHAFADLDQELHAIGAQLPPLDAIIPPSEPTGTTSASTEPSTTSASTGTASTEPNTQSSASEPPNPVVVDEMTGIPVPTDADTGMALPVPNIPEPDAPDYVSPAEQPSTGPSTGPTNGVNEGMADAGSGLEGVDPNAPNAGAGAGVLAAQEDMGSAASQEGGQAASGSPDPNAGAAQAEVGGESGGVSGQSNAGTVGA